MNRSGFTVLELLIVVAMVGILSAIALPNYAVFTSRARQTEAKLFLATVFNMQKTHAVEYSSYSACYREMGIDREGTVFYYTLAFGADPFISITCGPNGNLTCYMTGYQGSTGVPCPEDGTSSTYLANAKGIGVLPVLINVTPYTLITQGAFTQAVAGNISTRTPAYDRWQINERKFLWNHSPNL